MFTQLKPAFIMLLIWTAITGVVYPALVTTLAQGLFPSQANGSLLKNEQGKPVGSALIGQPFADARYFWGRPSATSPIPDNGAASSGSNLGPTNPALADAIKARVQALKEADPNNQAAVPIDLVTASGSGLDPHISPAAAHYQIERVAQARRISTAKISELIEKNTEKRLWGVLGEPRVNVLKLNLALDGLWF
jgi:potassium-transporting ATPase KdpC subunit